MPRSVYYASRYQRVDAERLELRAQIRALHQLSRGSAGSRTLSLLMQRNGYAIGRWLARKLMQECGLLSRQQGKHRHRGAREEALAPPNLLKRRFMPASPNQVWCGDISYIRFHGGWCYLALVVALYSRRVVGSALSLSPDANLACRAMRNALETRRRHGRLLFHSDQGIQYKSKQYRQLLWRSGVMQSMSRRGNCLENSPMERVFRSLKSEWIPSIAYKDLHHASRDTQSWLKTGTTRLDHISITEGYPPASMKNNGKRLRRCPDFVIHYNTATT